MRTALVVYDGVLDDECEAFRSVLGLLRDAEVITVAAERRRYLGPGGAQLPDATFDELDAVDVVVVPGGIGCERATDDPALRSFLQRMERTASFVAASSTGTVVVASAGLLHGRTAATHWLAADLLHRYGSETDERRVVMTGNVITCEGRISAVEAAFAIVDRIEGSSGVDRIRATLLDQGRPLLAEPAWYDRVAARLLGRPTLRRPPRRPSSVAPDHRDRDASPPTEPPVTPLSVMIELVEDDDTVRRLKRAQRRRS